jgi:hypothetical protein
MIYALTKDFHLSIDYPKATAMDRSYILVSRPGWNTSRPHLYLRPKKQVLVNYYQYQFNLQKPFTVNEFAENVRQLLDRQ